MPSGHALFLLVSFVVAAVAVVASACAVESGSPKISTKTKNSLILLNLRWVSKSIIGFNSQFPIKHFANFKGEDDKDQQQGQSSNVVTSEPGSTVIVMPAPEASAETPLKSSTTDEKPDNTNASDSSKAIPLPPPDETTALNSDKKKTYSPGN